MNRYITVLSLGMCNLQFLIIIIIIIVAIQVSNADVVLYIYCVVR